VRGFSCRVPITRSLGTRQELMNAGTEAALMEILERLLQEGPHRFTESGKLKTLRVPPDLVRPQPH
jgi:hypothetical protein